MNIEMVFSLILAISALLGLAKLETSSQKAFRNTEAQYQRALRESVYYGRKRFQ